MGLEQTGANPSFTNGVPLNQGSADPLKGTRNNAPSWLLNAARRRIRLLHGLCCKSDTIYSVRNIASRLVRINVALHEGMYGYKLADKYTFSG